jgi:hypothetical protein
MAIIIRDKTQCALCAEILGADDDVVSTSHFIADSADPLWKYSDAGMHRSCFLDWSDRERFVDQINSTVGQTVWRNGTSHRMAADGTINVVRVRSE